MREPDKNRANAARVFEAVANGKLAPRVWKTMPFERAGEALALLEQRKVLGKIVLTP